MYSLRKFHGELLDEGGHVLVGDDLALKFLDAEGRLRNLDLHVLLDLDLAAESETILDLPAAEEAGLGRENGAATLKNLNLALTAVRLSAASGRKEDLLVGESMEKVTALRNVKSLLAIVDVNLDGSVRSEL